MSTKTTRRRQHHGEIDDSKDEHLNTFQSDSLRETLLAEYDSNDRHLEDSSQKSQLKIWDQKQREPFCLTCISQFVNSCIRWIASIVVTSGSILGRLLCLQSVNQCGKYDEKILFSLSPLQEERLQYLKKRLDISFDISRVDHQVALKQLWKLAYPQRALPPLKSEKWKDMGWQSADPSTDFRFPSMRTASHAISMYPSKGFYTNRMERGLNSSIHLQQLVSIYLSCLP